MRGSRKRSASGIGAGRAGEGALGVRPLAHPAIGTWTKPWKRARATIDAGGELRRPARTPTLAGEVLIRSTPEPAVPTPGRARLATASESAPLVLPRPHVVASPGSGSWPWWAINSSVNQWLQRKPIATGPRQQVTVELRDGSRVVLARKAGSRLEPASLRSRRASGAPGGTYFEVDATTACATVCRRGTRSPAVRDLSTQFAVGRLRRQVDRVQARTAPTAACEVTGDHEGSIPKWRRSGSGTKSASGRGPSGSRSPPQVATVVQRRWSRRTDLVNTGVSTVKASHVDNQAVHEAGRPTISRSTMWR